MAIWTFQHLCSRERPHLDSSAFRDALAVEAQRARNAACFDRSVVMAAGARRLGLPTEAAEQLLFGDLPGERRLRLPESLPDSCSLAVQTNLDLARGLLRLASEVTIEIYGGARAVVRQVRLRRLLCTIRRIRTEGVCLGLSGPFSLFRHTTMYGRALASILPVLPWSGRFDLAARCMLRGRLLTVHLRPGNPIVTGEPPRPYDSRLEERFAREFARANLDWDLVREPEPVEVGDALMFPDFALVHRRDTSKRFLLEIVGFWTPDYLCEKLERLRSIPQTPLILCIDRGLNCSAGDLPAHARVIWFHKRIEPQSVLAAIEAAEPEASAYVERIELDDLFLDWAGRHPSSSPVHRRLASVKAGDPVRLRLDGHRIAVEAGDGPIAMLSHPASIRWATRLNRVLSVRLVQKVGRRAAQSAPQWRTILRCEHWAVPVLEVVLTASATAPQADSRSPR